MKVYTIEQKMSGTGTIHDIASDLFDRGIRFSTGCKYAVVLAAYYGGKGYTTHKTANAAARKSYALSMADYSHKIIDDEGNTYTAVRDYEGHSLVKD